MFLREPIGELATLYSSDYQLSGLSPLTWLGAAATVSILSWACIQNYCSHLSAPSQILTTLSSLEFSFSEPKYIIYMDETLQIISTLI